MEEYFNRNELDSLRAPHESDYVWRAKRMFLERHCNDYEKARLLCLSQIFINVNFLGCKYSDSLMEKVREMGAGICEHANNGHRKNFGKGYMKGSAVKRAKTSLPTKMARVADQVPENTKAKNFMLLKAEISVMENRADALQSLNQAASRVKVGWELRDVDTNGYIALNVDSVTVLRCTFPGGKTPLAKQCAAAATLAAISSENIEIRNVSGNLELWRGKIGPAECYGDYVTSTLRKAAVLLPAQGTAYARLQKALTLANIPLKFIAEQGTGWQERVSLTVLNVELASALLRKSECTKGKEAQRVEELAASVISMITSPTLKIVEAEKGFTIAV